MHFAWESRDVRQEGVEREEFFPCILMITSCQRWFQLYSPTLQTVKYPEIIYYKGVLVLPNAYVEKINDHNDYNYMSLFNM